ncbi:acyl-CoA synthetase (AMP-forming)/AMP-acid ligase II [Frankia sp. EI5c]|uniref:class I adenylate-forming enzyme family protein n=1 Tax=Frankia sp. EI5c TaxID=683316 RepID=UPI0007C37310|nr:fatty acid--CoA ligase family protein [Frankia sp. EI5c]OAA27841.1 acyl-CoA synthetase (AMP-forming)/AMP-acid ligase II [Frankia sp. EI5c]
MTVHPPAEPGHAEPGRTEPGRTAHRHGTGELPTLCVRLGRVLALDPAAPALEFERRWHTWGELAAAADAVAPHVRPGQRVAILLRNRPPQLGLLLGLLRAGARVVAVNPGRGAERVRADTHTLGVDIVAGSTADLTAFAPQVRWLASDTLGTLTVTDRPPATASATSPTTTPATDDAVAVEMLTSGTTGPPKRVPLTYETFSRVLAGAKHYERNPDAGLRLRRGVVIINAPLVHLGGLFRVLQCVNDGRAFCLLEKFTVGGWADAVRRHRPSTVSLVPAALRMVLDADLDRADLAGVRSVISGTAPLSPDDAEAFEEKYGVPVLTSYAATEFGGGVAGWNLADHQSFGAAKRGSVGRAHAGCELRVVDPDTGTERGPNEPGLLEVRASQLGGTAWTRTTDLARLDSDGFLWILGRADQAIIRGGFKVLPDDVRAALEHDPRVRGAAVIGRPDDRLGAVPVAAVELRPGAGPTSAAELLAAVANRLARYEMPTELWIVDALPRTPSGKVDLAAVRELLAPPAGSQDHSK